MHAMAKFLSFFSAVLTFASLLAGCHFLPELTPETQNGANTFSCLVNGRVWLPEDHHPKGWFAPTIPGISGGYRRVFQRNDSTGIFISARNNKTGRIQIYLQDVHVGKHLLNTNTTVIDTAGFPSSYATYEFPNFVDRYMTNAKHTGYVNLTRSERDGIISGTFDFRALLPGGKTVHISNGRFDIDQKTLNR